MADIHDQLTRSRNMAAIKSGNTQPELRIRKALHSKGFRYKIQDKNLPGKPDLVFPKFSAVIFVNGCFWHRHDCHLFRMPATRADFWNEKLNKNVERDKFNNERLMSDDWRVCLLWECSLKGKGKLDFDYIIFTLQDWLKSDHTFLEVRGDIFA